MTGPRAPQLRTFGGLEDLPRSRVAGATQGHAEVPRGESGMNSSPMLPSNVAARGAWLTSFPFSLDLSLSFRFRLGYAQGPAPPEAELLHCACQNTSPVVWHQVVDLLDESAQMTGAHALQVRAAASAPDAALAW